MRYLLTTLILLTALCTEAQEFTGIWDIPWGKSMAETQRLIKQQHGYSPEVGRPEPQLEYKMVAIDGHFATSVTLYFALDELAMAKVVISRPKDLEQALDQYQETLAKLVEKYGPSDTQKLIFPRKEQQEKHKKDGLAKYINKSQADHWRFPKGSTGENVKYSIFSALGREYMTILYMEGEMAPAETNEDAMKLPDDY